MEERKNKNGTVYCVILTGTLPAAILLYGAPSSSGLRTDTRARPGHCTHAGFAVLVYTCSRMRVSWTFLALAVYARCRVTARGDEVQKRETAQATLHAR